MDNELRDLVHEDGTCASTGGEMPAKRRRLDVKKGILSLHICICHFPLVT